LNDVLARWRRFGRHRRFDIRIEQRGLQGVELGAQHVGRRERGRSAYAVLKAPFACALIAACFSSSNVNAGRNFCDVFSLWFAAIRPEEQGVLPNLRQAIAPECQQYGS
jgi:hypothetical protein